MSDDPTPEPGLPKVLTLMREFVQRYLTDEPHFTPHVDFVLEGDQHVLMLAPPIGSDNEREKAQFNLFARAFIQAYDVWAFAMASEVWMALGKSADGALPAERLDRVEGVMVFAATREGREYQWLARLWRDSSDDDESGRVVKLEQVSLRSNDDVSGASFGGRWHDMFNPAEVPTDLVVAVRERMREEIKREQDS